MAERLKVDICVIGAGSGGLTVAAGACQMGASVALVEKDKMGGDCLNYGCVPSKALLAAGHAAEAVARARAFGAEGPDPIIDSAKVYGHVRATIEAIAPNDSVERFAAMGVKVIKAQGRFTGPRQVSAGDYAVDARRVVVATGSSPFVPPIEGLDAVPYLTNESIFGLAVLPAHLIVVGGGPIGIEMAQAHRHLGSKVTVLEMFSMMPRDDPELVAVLRARLAGEGVDIQEGIKISRVEKAGGGLAAIVDRDGAESRIEGSHLLIAAGRRPNVDGLDLEAAGIAYTAKGIEVDARLKTTNKKVFAIGDVAGGFQFTHMAAHQAGIVIRNALFRLPAKAETSAVPWVTYTSPELAQVGLSEQQARDKHGDIRVLRWPFADNDRARAERRTEGFVKAVTLANGRILGASMVGPGAGELIHTWVLAIGAKLKIGAVASMIAPYPTLGEVNKRAAGGFYTDKLFGPRTKWLVRLLSRFG